MRIHLAREQLHHGIYGRHFILITHHHAFHAVVDAEHVQGIGTSEQVEDHIVLSHKAIEELHGCIINAIVAVGKHIGLLDANHHQIVGFQLFQPIRRFRGDIFFLRHERGGAITTVDQAVVHVVFRVAYGHHSDFLVVSQGNHLVVVAQHGNGLVVQALAQVGIGFLLQVGHEVVGRHCFEMVETSAILVAQDLLAAFFQPCRSIGVAFRCVFDGLDGIRHVVGQNQHIVAGHESHIWHAILTHLLRHTLHIEAVGEDQTFEAHLFFQQVGDHAMRERGRGVLHLLNGGEVQMAHHGAVHTVFNHVTERCQLNVAHLVHRTGHGRQGKMRVGGGVAMAGEVFHRGNQALALHALGIGTGFFTDLLWILAKATHSDDGISCVGIDIGHRCKIHMNAHALALLGHLLAHFID